MQCFQTPFVFNELCCEVIQKLRVRGERALGAEIIFRLYQAGTEIVLPQTIHRHARRQRVLGIHEPAGQVETTALAAG